MITFIKILILATMIFGLPISIALLAHNVTPKDGWEAIVGLVFALALTFIELFLLCLFIIL